MLMKVQQDMTDAIQDEGTPVSVKIRERLRAARQRFHSNDNIADFIRPGELEALLGFRGRDEMIHRDDLVLV